MGMSGPLQSLRSKVLNCASWTWQPFSPLLRGRSPPLGLRVEYPPPASQTDVGVVVGPVTLPGNSCGNKNALTGFIKAASVSPGDRLGGSIKRWSSWEQLLSRLQCGGGHCEGHPPLAGVKDVPEVGHHETALSGGTSGSFSAPSLSGLR